MQVSINFFNPRTKHVCVMKRSGEMKDKGKHLDKKESREQVGAKGVGVGREKKGGGRKEE